MWIELLFLVLELLEDNAHAHVLYATPLPPEPYPAPTPAPHRSPRPLPPVLSNAISPTAAVAGGLQAKPLRLSSSDNAFSRPYPVKGRQPMPVGHTSVP